ncbi:BlaI/MecI/CopY family transcriptional regulator [Acetivibrio cellulolyticus]|uniref:BlaI/MecI/CopY family transcriptional regulator n=1 Tax=Acetivibrio cellulolyticus TaxID=35830 RepID=UPI0001E30570|nr:BlaI/MecI/CopY family transcriptional regulator [Acetivibrio cellulolyticus]
MNKVPNISDSEWYIMKVIWNRSPITANQVIEELEGTIGWKPKTIKTLISRLVRKEVLGFTKEGREYYYYSLVTEQQCIFNENRTFLERVYGGVFKEMLAAFLEHQKLTNKEIDEIKEILDNKVR